MTCFWGRMTFRWYFSRSTGLSCLPVVISFLSGKSCFSSPSVLVCGSEERGDSSLVWMEHQFRDTGFLPSNFSLRSSFFCRVSWFTCVLASVNMKWGYNFPAICTKTLGRLPVKHKLITFMSHAVIVETINSASTGKRPLQCVRLLSH